MNTVAGPAHPPARVAVFARLREPGLGDLVQRNIFLALLRRAYPAAAVTHVLPRSALDRYGEFLARHSYATETMPCPEHGDERPEAWDDFRAQGRAAGFEMCVVDPDSQGLGGVEALKCGIGSRIGFAAGHTGAEGLTSVIRVVRPLFGAPDLYDFARCLAQAIGRPTPGPADVLPAIPYTPEGPLDWPRPVVALHPGGAPHWNRRWPQPAYVELSRRLAAKVGTVVLIGSAGEAGELAAMAARIGGHGRAQLEVAAGGSLNRLCHLLAHCDLLIGGDSAPAHIAASLGRPTIVLYGPTATEFMWARVYPHHEGINLRYPCQRIRNLPLGEGPSAMPCAHACRYPYEAPEGPYPKCLADISVDTVHAAVLRRLGQMEAAAVQARSGSMR